MKKGIKFLVLLALIAAQTVKADNEIYGFFSEDGKTFTLNFDEDRTKNNGLTPDEWIGYEYQSNRTKVENVVFDNSMDKARPTTTFSWFGGFSKLTTIEHIYYLHTDEVTTMTDMFWNCRRLTSLDIHHFRMEKVTNVNGMFADCATLTTICCDDDWSKSSITESKNLFAGCKALKGGNGTVFSSDHTTLEYARPDEGTAKPGYFTLPELYGVFDEENSVFNIYYDGNKAAQGGVSSKEWRDEAYASMRGKMETVTFDCSMSTARPTATNHWFEGFSKLRNIYNFAYLNTSEVTDMSYMFANCESVQMLNVCDFDMSKVTDAREMFSGCTSLVRIYCNDDWSVLGFNGEDMFKGCTALCGMYHSQVTQFDEAHTGKEYARPSKGTDMPGYFIATPSVYGVFSKDGNTFTLYCDTKAKERGGITDWKTNEYVSSRAGVKKVVVDESMRYYSLSSTYAWFSSFSNMTTIEHIEYLNTYHTKDMRQMFKDCSSLGVLDLRGMLINDLLYADEMFKGCTSLKTIYCSDDLDDTRIFPSLSGKDMFADCTSLVGGKGAKYDASYTDKTCANPWSDGYFTVVDEIYAFLSKGTFYVCYDGKRLNTPVLTFYPDGRIESESVRPEEWMSDDYAEQRKQVSEIRFYTYMNKSVPSTAHWFEGFSNATKVVAMNVLMTDEVTDMSYMFAGCTKLETIQGLEDLKTGKVQSMKGMFLNCQSVKDLDVSNFDMSNVKDASSMFAGCKSLETIACKNDWSAFSFDDTDMFEGCTSLQGGAIPPTPYSAEHTGKEYARFDEGSALPGYFSGDKEIYGVFSADGKTYTLYYDRKKTARGGFAPWDEKTTSNNRDNVEKAVLDITMKDALPTSTSSWFMGFIMMTSIENLSYLNTSEVIFMDRMFRHCHRLETIDVRSFDMRKVINIREMFHFCTKATNIYLPTKYRVENITDIADAFSDCNSLTEVDLHVFDMKNVTNMDKLFCSDDKLEVIYCDDDWSQIQGLKATGNMFKECYSLIGGQGSKCADLAGEIEYAHPDGGKTNPGYFTAFPGEFYGIYSSTGDTLTLYYDKKKIEREGCDWTLNIYNDWNRKVTTVIFDESVKDARPTSCYAWFASFTQLRRIQHLDYLNTSEVTDMSYMFNFCTHLTYLDLRTFDFNKVQKAYGLFAYCFNLRFILCNDDWSKTGNSVYESGMFNSCSKLAGDHGTMFNANETRLGYARPDEGPSAPGYFSKEVPVAFYYVLDEETGVMTFYYDNLLLERKGEIIPESTSGYEWEPRVMKVTTAVFDESVKEARLTKLSLLFSRFKHLTDIVHLDYLNTSEVTDMSYMFSECENLASLDVSSFDISKVTDMSWMFAGCTSLKTIYCDEDWSKNESVESSAMFFLCIAIEGGAGTVYDNDHQRIEYARPDQGTSAPGYFTSKKTPTAAENVTVAPSAQKLLRNGILYILRNGKTYNANGQLIINN